MLFINFTVIQTVWLWMFNSAIGVKWDLNVVVTHCKAAYLLVMQWNNWTNWNVTVTKWEHNWDFLSFLESHVIFISDTEQLVVCYLLWQNKLCSWAENTLKFPTSLFKHTDVQTVAAGFMNTPLHGNLKVLWSLLTEYYLFEIYQQSHYNVQIPAAVPMTLSKFLREI